MSKTKSIKDGHRRRSCSSKTAKITVSLYLECTVSTLRAQ